MLRCRMRFGDPASLLPILSFILTASSRPVAEAITAAGYQVWWEFRAVTSLKAQSHACMH